MTKGSQARIIAAIFAAGTLALLAAICNDLWKGRSPERFYDSLEWLYGWKVENCL